MAVAEILENDEENEARVSRLSSCAEMVVLSNSFIFT